VAKIEKRQGTPIGQASVGVQSPIGMKCGICGAPAQKRFRNAYREIDCCRLPQCIQQASAWASNKPFNKRVVDPPRVWKEPVETKFLSRKADAVEKAPMSRARAR